MQNNGSLNGLADSLDESKYGHIINSKMLLALLANKEIVIYGNGYVAHSFFYAIKRHNLDKRVSCFVVSKTNVGEECGNGIPLIAVRELKESTNPIICVAV
ncbi:MAG: hypothetical protein NC548_35940, partial [Lachnospiraceae bacterium]|nr:hypothetical protein [Lachnospiraceae bacterium]